MGRGSLDNSLEPNVMGRSGQFFWFVGVVEDRIDPLKLGRLKIRMLGWHTEDKTYIPTPELLWAHPHKGIDCATNGLGFSPVGPVEGEWVYGYYKDQDSAQDPIILGSIGGIPEEAPNVNVGFYDPGPPPGGNHILENSPRKIYQRYYPNDGSGHDLISEPKGPLYPRTIHPWGCILGEADTNRLARGEMLDQTVIGVQRRQRDNGRPGEFGAIPIAFVHPAPTRKWVEHESPAAPVYPFNKVMEDESGNIIEMDSTPGAERIHIFHRSGTRIEIGGGANGADMQIKVGGEYRSQHMKKSFSHFQNNCNITIDGECNVYVRSDCNLQVDGDMNVHVQGNYTEKVHGNYYTDIDGNRLVRIGGNDELDVKGNHGEYIGGTEKRTSQGDMTDTTGGNFNRNAASNTTDTAGSAFTRNAGSDINDRAGGSISDSAGGTIHLHAGGEVAGDGSAVHWNSGHTSGSGPSGPAGPQAPALPVVPPFPAALGFQETIGESAPDPSSETVAYEDDNPTTSYTPPSIILASAEPSAASTVTATPDDLSSD